MTDLRQELHDALDQPDFPPAALLKQAMARLDEPARGRTHAWQVVLAAVLVIALVATFLAIRANRATPNPAGSTGWHSGDLPGTRSGFRAAAYDAGRDCLWIITKVPGGSAADTVTLNRMNVADRSTTGSLFSVQVSGYLNGFVAVDARGEVWMSWGRLLIEYDPDSKHVQTFKLPPEASVARASAARTAVVHPEGSGTDGNVVAMTVGPDSEIWILVNSVQAVFGFNPATSTWDRFARVPLDPVSSFTSLAAKGPAKLVMSGVLIQHALYSAPHLAVIDTSTGTSSVLPPRIDAFALLDDSTAVYAERTSNVGPFNLGRIDLSTGLTTSLALNAPISNPNTLVTDASGRVWFSMVGYWTVGITRLDPHTGAVKSFPFPYVKQPGTPEPVVSDCPSPRSTVDYCSPLYADPSAVPGDPEVQQIVFDSHGDIWVVAAAAALDDPNTSHQAAPVMELTAAGARA